MGSIGTTEVLVVLVVALIVLGPNRLPDAARQVGKAMAELRKMAGGFQAEMRDAMSIPPTSPSAQSPPTSQDPAPNAPPGPGNGHVAPPPLPERPEDAELR